MDKIIVILGPTASGKTELALKLAKKFNGEIISVDSRQIFKEMNIGTAKPAQFQKSASYPAPLLVKGIPHYLIDAFKPGKEINAAIYKKLVLKLIGNIRKRNKLPFLVGGTGLYIRAVVDNLDFPKGAPSKKMREKLTAMPLKKLFKIYKGLDNIGAKMIDKKNKRRLTRAIEVCLLTKKPFWQQRHQKKPLFEALQIGIKPGKAFLSKNISKRTNEMLELGLEKEARKLFKKYGVSSILSKTIGYLEWLPYLEKKIDSKQKKEIAAEIKKHTHQYAKRQMAWFKKDKRIVWLTPRTSLKKAAKLINHFIL